jgi:hypothetical protein
VWFSFRSQLRGSGRFALPSRAVSRDFKEFGETPPKESCKAATGNDSAKNRPLTGVVIFTLWNRIVNQIFNIPPLFL